MGYPKDEATGDYDSLIAQAEAAVEALRDTYRDQLANDVAALEEVWARLEGGAPAEATLAELHGIAHNIKGRAVRSATTSSPKSAPFCDYLRSGKRSSADERNIIHMHIRMLKTVSRTTFREMAARRAAVLPRSSTS